MLTHRTSASPARFILLTPFADYDFFAPMRQGMSDAAAALAVEAIFTGTADGDVQELARRADEALEGGYSGIAINMTDAGAFREVAARALERRVPLISFNVDDPGSARVAMVGQNMLAAGGMFGGAIGKAIPEGAHVLMTMHDPGITALEERVRGAKGALSEKNLLWTELFTGTRAEQAIESVRAALSANPEISAVLSTGQADTQAAGLAIERYFPERALVAAGFDTSADILRMIEKGVIHLTVDQQPYAQGYFALSSLAVARAKGLAPVSVDTGATIVRKG